MNWLQWILRLTQAAPYIVAGVHAIHSEASASTKTKLATDALMLATGVADAVDPQDAGLTNAISSIVGGVVASVTPAAPVAPSAIAAPAPVAATAPALQVGPGLSAVTPA